MSVDPSHYLPATNGGTPPLLRVHNISARPEFNGQLGQAVAFSAGRYVVALLDAKTVADGAATQPIMLKVKPENLSEAGYLDQLKFGLSMAFQSAKAYVSSPSMQEWGKGIILWLPPIFQSRMTPNHALLGAAIVTQLFLVLMYLCIGRLIGFTKVFALVSLVALLLAVSSPDWMEGCRANKPFKLIAWSAAGNFTRRWKNNLVQMSGYANISDRMALASLVLVLLFGGKVVLTGPPPAEPPQMLNIPLEGGKGTTAPQTLPQYDLQYIYKLGYSDANSGKKFGTSLPEDIIKHNDAQEVSHAAQDQYGEGKFDWAYNPPPPLPKSKSTLGMGTMLSMFTLYRFGKDVVVSPDGGLVLDARYVMARLRGTETWRLGIMAISFYRVVTALSSLVR